MFADQFSTSIAEQTERIKRQDAENEVYFERLRQAEIEAWERAMTYREQARQILDPILFEDFEKRYQRIYGSRGEYSKPEYAGYSALDWWHNIVRKEQEAHGNRHDVV